MEKSGNRRADTTRDRGKGASVHSGDTLTRKKRSDHLGNVQWDDVIESMIK